jgi:hypothetical protein
MCERRLFFAIDHDRESQKADIRRRISQLLLQCGVKEFPRLCKFSSWHVIDTTLSGRANPITIREACGWA